MKARTKNILRGIRGSLNRFLSILFIVALGSGFMAGLAATSPDMYYTADKYFDDNNMYDIDVKSTIGFSEEDATAISQKDGVLQAYKAKVIDSVWTSVAQDGTAESYTSRVYSFVKSGLSADSSNATEMNGFKLVEGRLPQNTNECVIQSPAGRYLGNDLKVGDTLTLSQEDTNYQTLKSQVASSELTVVGKVQSPICISIVQEVTTAGTGTITLNVYTLENFFSFDYYTDIYLVLNGTKELNTFDDSYDNLVLNKVDEIEQLGTTQVEVRKNQLLSDAETQVESLKLLVNSYKQAISSQNQLDEDTKARIKSLKDTANTLLSANPNSTLAQSLLQTAEFLENSQSTSTDETLNYLTTSLEKVEATLESVKSATWIVSSRMDSLSFSTYDSNVGKVSALSKVFPVFFFFVALLVALTTMTRLVEENRGQIGTLKAIGYSNFQILLEYLLYSLLSSFIGCVLGFVVGFKLFPWAISSAYGMMFTVPQCATPFRWEIVAWVAPVTIGSILLATVWACWSEFVSTPATLMRPKAPAAGKRILLERITFLWKRFSFTQKVTFRNLFRYKKRLFMTIFGIAGCSALLLTGFGIRDSVNDIVDKQYVEICKYDFTVMTKTADWQTDEELTTTLNNSEKISAYVSAYEGNGTVLAKSNESLTICVPSRVDDFSNFILLRERVSQKSIAFPKSGQVVLTEKLCETLGISVGDTVTIQNADGKKGELVVSAIAENHVTSYAYMTAETYSQCFGTSPQFTSILCKTNSDEQSVTKELMSMQSVLYVNSLSTLRNNFSQSIKSMNGVILVLILSAGLLSVVVLYNLTNVNICERRKELATLRVLGFHKIETQRYIFREINILSLIGSILGLFVGIWLHSFVVRTVEVDQVMFGRTIYFWSYLFALGISMIFTLLVNLVMKKRINQVDMVEAMKANE